VLPVAIDRAVAVEGSRAERIRLSSEGFEGAVDIAADGSGEATGWGRYVAAVARELTAVGRPPIGLEGWISSDLPARAGLGSSGALETAVGVALCRVADFEIASFQLIEALQRAERTAVGVPCGVMDQASAALGRAGHALALDCGKLRYRHVPLHKKLAIVAIDSGVPRSLETSSYAEVRSQLETAVGTLRGRPVTDLIPEELADFILGAGIDDLVARRLRYIVAENQRVNDTELAIATGDSGALRHLFAAGHEGLRDDLGVSTAELDALVEIAVEQGAIGARLTGAGFGGSVVVLAATDEVNDLAPRIETRYRVRTGLTPAVVVCGTSDGALLS